MTPPEKMSAKKRKRDEATQKNINETTKKPRRTETFGPRRVINGDPIPDVRNIPCNEDGRFINKSSKAIEVLMSCSFCTKKFILPEDYYLHQAEKHAKLYGHLPNQPTNGPTNESYENKVHIQNNTPKVINNTPNRRQRCSVYVSQQSDTSSSESSECDSEVPVGINTNDADNYTQENLNDTEQRRKKKKVSSKSKETDLSSTLNGDESSSDSEIQNLLRKFIKFSKSLVKRIRNKKEKRTKVQRNIMYKCKECSLHFLKESKWRKHIKRADHPTNPSKCEHCMLKFSDKSLQEHVKMHMNDGQIQKKVRFNIVTEKSYSSSEDGTSSDGTSSDSVGEENNSVPNSSYETSNINITESVPTEIEQHINCTDTDNVNNTNEVDSNKQVNANKRFKPILYKCDDCDKHFLNERNLRTHKLSFSHRHNIMVKGFACNICTIKFSCTNTLIKHKQLHHSGTDNLSKEDFKIISTDTGLFKEKSYSSSEDGTISDGTSSDSDGEENNSVPNSSYETSNINVTESVPTEIEQHINYTDTDNVNNTNEVDSSKQVNANKRFKPILYKCDDCDKHFLKERNLRTHKLSFSHRHNIMVKGFACNICTIKFSCTNTLIKHKQLHHSGTDNLSKEDFKIIWSSDSDGEENNSVPNSSYETSNINVKESVPTEIEQHINYTDTDNVNNTNEVDSSKQVNANQRFKVILYKCDDCEKHFLTRKGLISHMSHISQEKHYSMVNDFACNICTIKFSSTNTLIKHKQLHHSGTDNLSKEDFKIISHTGLLKEKSYSSSEDGTISDGTSSDSDGEENNSVPNSSYEPSNINITESVPTEIEQHINCTDTDHVNNTNEVDSNKQVNANKRFKPILYKCDDCDKHFLKERNLRTHKLSFSHRHNIMVKGFACNICTIKFSCTNTLIKHKQLHHSGTDNLSKEDFKIIWSSDSDGEENNSVPNSSYETSNINVEESVPTEIEQHINCTDTDNVNNTNEVDSSKQVNANQRFKVILYKCDDCEKHFLTRKGVISHMSHISLEKHYSMVNDIACNICTIKFCSTKTLKNHKRLHHSGFLARRYLSKKDFKIISRTDLLKEKSYSSSEDGTNSYGTNSDSESEENNSVPYSSYETSSINVKKSVPNEIEQHMHMNNGQIQKKVRFNVVTEKSYSSSEDSTSSDETRSDSDDKENDSVHKSRHEKSYSSSKDITSSDGTSSVETEPSEDGDENNSVHNSSHDESSNKNVKESVPTEIEQHINCTDTDNVNNTNKVDSNKQVNANKRFKAILFKCDECEKHFLTRKKIILHKNNSLHKKASENDIACNICTIEFCSTNTLIQHKELHHSGTDNVSKEDFKIIPWMKYGISLRDRARIMNPRKINCTDNRKKSPKKNLNNFIIYRCEGCDTHFSRYKTWWLHLNNRCKNTISYEFLEKCQKCEIYFSPASFPEHLKVHEDNPALSEHQFRVISRKPKNFKSKIISQSNIVSTTEAEVEPQSANQVAVADSLVNISNDRDISSASDLCKIKLTKTITGTGQGEGWSIVMNQSVASMNVNKNSNPPLAEEVNASTIDDHMNTNQALDQNSIRDVETDRVESAEENNAETVTSKYFSSVTDLVNIGNSVTDPNNKTSHHTEQTISSENNKNKFFGESIIVNFPRLPSNVDNFQNKTPSEENTDRIIVSTADTTMENFENINAHNVNNEIDQNKIQQIKHEKKGDEIKTEGDAHISEGVPIQNECLIEEINSENNSFEPQKSSYNQNIKTETGILEADQQIKDKLFAKEIKAENIVPEEDPQIKNEPFIKEIKTENIMSEVNPFIKFKEEIKTEDNDVAPEAIPIVKNETVAEEIQTVIDDLVPETQNNRTFLSDIKIINSFSLKLKFENDPQLDSEEPCSTENEVGNIDSTESQDMVEVVDNIGRPETSQSTHMTFDKKCPDNNEIYSSKSDKQLKRDIISQYDDDDSQSTIILVCDDVQEQAGTQETDNDAQPDETAERKMSTNNYYIEVCKNENSHSSKHNNKQNKESDDDLIAKHRAQNEKKHKNNVHLTKNNAWGSIYIINDENSSHIFNVHQIDDTEATEIDFGRVRDRTEIIKIKEEPGTSNHIKIEKADDQRTKTKLRSENEELNKNTEILDLSDDDDVTEMSTVETTITYDDDVVVCVKVKEELGTLKRIKIEKADYQRTKTKLKSENEELNKNTEIINLSDDDVTEISTVETIIIDDDGVDVCVKVKEEPGTSKRIKIEKADYRRTKTKLKSENEELNKNTVIISLSDDDDDDVTEISTVETIIIDDDGVDVCAGPPCRRRRSF